MQGLRDLKELHVSPLLTLTVPHPLLMAWAEEVDVALAEISASSDTDQPYDTPLTADRDRGEPT